MKALISKMASSLLVLSLVSCATNEPQSAQQALASTIQTPPAVWASLADNSEVPVKWLESFNDPVLLSLIDEGKNNNRDLQVAALGLDRAVLLAEQAGVALKPKANLSLGGGQLGSLKNSQTSNNFSTGLDVSWELDLWGRIRSGINSAEADLRSAQADYVFAQSSLSANISKAYFIVIEAKLQAVLTQSNLDLLTETLRVVNVQFDNDMVAAQDVALAKANLASAQDSLLTVRNSQRDALRALEVLLGRYPNAEVELPNILPVLAVMPTAGIPSELLERRPDMIAADSRVASAFSLTEQARAARLPTIKLTSSLNGSSNELSNLLNPANIAWQLGANLLMPIFDGGAARINVEIATLAQEQALVTYAQTALTTFAEVENNLDQGLVLAEREKELRTVQVEFTEAYRLTNLRYLEGESDLLELLQIQQQLNSANTNLLSIQRGQLDQRVNLYMALGGSW